MADQPQSSILLSELAAPLGQRRAALAVSVLLFVVFLGTWPFAQIAWAPLPGFVLIQQTLLFANDLITAALLFGQYAIGRTRSLNVLAAGYLFTALIVIPHALSFPGTLTEKAILGGGPQTAAWLYVGWHAVLPLTIIAFAIRQDYRREEEEPISTARTSIIIAALVAVGGVLIMTLLFTVGHPLLPPLINNGHFTMATRVVIGTLLVLPLCALLLLARRQFRSVLDLWLMAVMFAWFCTIALGAFVSGGRFDTGWYVGRIFDWLSSIFILLMLLSETIALYSRNVRAAAVERRERERRLNEMEAVLIHLSRVTELGQNVSALIHEINQPLTAISNYLAAGIELAENARQRPVLERAAEQVTRATEMISRLRDFVARRESEKRIGDVDETLREAVRLALVGASAEAATVEIRCAPAASKALFDSVQIEQVVFNLVRNAIEAMADTARRILIISAALTPEQMIEISVADTGPGLSPEVRERLFEPFVTSKPSGLGVGLSVCRVIIEAHGGDLQAHDNPGGGTVFRFTLRQASTPDEPA